MGKIILVGSVHSDLKGPERLAKLLNHFQPEMIGIERTLQSASDHWNEYTRAKDKIKEGYRWNYPIDQFQRLSLAVKSRHYEVTSPAEYRAKNSHTEIYCLDKETSPDLANRLSQAKQQWVQEQLAKGKDITELLKEDETIQEFIKCGSVEKRQQKAEAIYDNPTSNQFCERYGKELYQEVVLDRDTHFVNQIKEIHSANPSKTFVAILGNAHIFGEYPESTYNLLWNYNPQRIKLRDADKL